MVEHILGLGARKTKLLFFLLLLVVISSNSSTTHAAEQLPVAKIASVKAPPDLSPNQDFTVVVTVDYSASISTDIAIFDAATSHVLACKGLIVPAGRNVFTFQMIGNNQPGLWKLVTSVRIWWHEGWYGNQNGTVFPFEITIIDLSKASLIVTSNVKSVSIAVDGVLHEISSAGIELSVERGLHEVETEPVLTTADGARAVFDHWSDGVRSLHREIYLASKLSLSAVYLTEYLLTVRSNLGDSVGSGWYATGTNATFGVIEPLIIQDTPSGQVTYEFNGWSGDSNSSSPRNQIVMTRPKAVLANWSEISSQASQGALFGLPSLVCLVGSLILITLGALIGKKGGKKRQTIPSGRKSVVNRSILLLFLCAMLVPLSAIQPVEASGIVQPGTVSIGNATWYHWSQAASDTLLIWLGGGIVEPTTLLVNPYEFESYNTMYFLQDLTTHYDALALKKGSIRYVDSTLNRTVFREPYLGSSDFIKDIRSWAHEHGYTYLYVVGYSVGAMAAAKELIQAHPNDWTSPDGLIIITTNISFAVTLEASALRASLLLLYGDKIAPEFTASGQAIFENAPEEGWREGFWFHKEFHVIPDVEHEVWTVRDTGEYDRRAVLLTIKFIETTKGLQFVRVKEQLANIALNSTLPAKPDESSKIDIVSVTSPSKVATDEAFAVTVKIQYATPTNSTVAVVAFDADTASIVSASAIRASGQGEAKLANTILSGPRSRSVHLSLIPLVRTVEDWTTLPGGTRSVIIQITDSFMVNIIIGYPNVPVQLDDQIYSTGAAGKVSTLTTSGGHHIYIPSVIFLENNSRAIFRQWNTTTSSSYLDLSVSHDVSLLAIYQKQYYLKVTSQLSQTSETGWYDENSIVGIYMAPFLVLEGKTYVFAGWIGDSNGSAPSSSVFMNSPKNIEASWREVKNEQKHTNAFQAQALFVASLTTVIGSIAFVWITFRKTRSN